MGVGIQILIWASWLADVVIQRKEDAFQRGISLLYAPVNWLTEASVENTEGNIGAGWAFVPPVLILYALVFAVLARLVKECYEA